MNENTKPQPCFDQAALLDTLIVALNLKNDAALARALNVAPPAISKIRHHRLPVGAAILLRMHEESGISIKDLRGMMGDHRPLFRTLSRKELERGVVEQRVRPPKPLTDYLRKNVAH